MASLSLDLKRLSLNGGELDCQKMSPSQARRATSCLSTYFLNRPDVKAHIQNEGKKIDFALTIGKTPTLQLKGAHPRTFTFEASKELREIKRIAHYQQNIGQLPLSVECPASKERVKTAKAAAKVLLKPKLPGKQAKMLAMTRVGENTISLTRNILFATPVLGGDSELLHHTGYYVGGIWTAFSFLELFDAKGDLKNAKKISDEEGIRRAKGRIGVAGLAATASLSYMAGRVFHSLEMADASFGMLAGATVLFGITSALSAGRAGLGAYRSYNFTKKIDEYLKNPALTEKQQLQGALRFLKDSVSVTPEERREIVEGIEREFPALSKEEKDTLIQQKLTDRTQVKLNHVKRRTTGKSLELILTQVEPLLQKLENGKGIEEARNLVQTVKLENKKRMAVYAIGVLASMIAFAAMLMLTFFSLGTLPFILYAVATAIALSMAIAGLIDQYKAPDHPLNNDAPVPSIA